jgi:hypothetical protein
LNRQSDRIAETVSRKPRRINPSDSLRAAIGVRPHRGIRPSISAARNTVEPLTETYVGEKEVVGTRGVVKIIPYGYRPGDRTSVVAGPHDVSDRLVGAHARVTPQEGFGDDEVRRGSIGGADIRQIEGLSEIQGRPRLLIRGDSRRVVVGSVSAGRIGAQDRQKAAGDGIGRRIIVKSPGKEHGHWGSPSGSRGVTGLPPGDAAAVGRRRGAVGGRLVVQLHGVAAAGDKNLGSVVHADGQRPGTPIIMGRSVDDLYGQSVRPDNQVGHGDADAGCRSARGVYDAAHADGNLMPI